MASGCDVSLWQGTIDFAKMRAKVDFVFIKASEAGFIDPRFAANWLDAKAAGLRRGAYHFYRANVNAGDQVRTFIETMRGDYGELPCVVDCEDTSSPAVWTAKQVADLKWFLNVLERFIKVKPIIYTGAWWWTPARMGLATWANQYDLWAANYVPEPTGKPVLPMAWTTYKYWQWTSSGHGADYGVSSRDLDLNITADVTPPPSPPVPVPVPVPVPAHPDPTFTATPAIVTSGQPVTIAWSAPGASGIHLGSSPVTGPDNSMKFWPATNSHYVLIVNYPGEPDVVLNVYVVVTTVPEPPVPEPVATPWTAEYFANTKLSGVPVYVTQLDVIALDWRTGSPNPAVPADLFSARFKRTAVYPASSRQYTIKADDGVRLFVDGALVIDKWVEQAATNHQAVVAVTAGSHIEIIEYFEQGGLASLSFDSALYTAAAPVVSIKPGRRGTGVHMLGGWSDLLAASKCRDAVFMDPGLASRYADKLGKTGCFDGKGVVMYRRYYNGQWPTFDQVMSQGMGNDPRILYIITNEGEGLNKPDPVEAIYAHASLDIAVAREMAKRGCHAAASTLATGNPNYTRADVCQAIRVAYAPWWNTFADENKRLYNKDIRPVWDQHDYSPNVQHIFDTWEGDITFAATARERILAAGASDVLDLFTPKVNEVMVGERNPHIAYVIERPQYRKVGLASPAAIAGAKTVHIHESDWYETRAMFNVLLCGFMASMGVYVSSETLIDVGGKGGALGVGWGPADVLKWEARYYEIWGRPVTDEYGTTCCLNKEGAAIFQGQSAGSGQGQWGSYYVGGMFDQLAPMWARP